MYAKGCGKRSVTLTFYLVRTGRETTTGKSERIACGQQAVTTGGGSRGVLLQDCTQFTCVTLRLFGAALRLR